MPRHTARALILLGCLLATTAMPSDTNTNAQSGAVPGAELLVPADTLFVLSTPAFPNLAETASKSPWIRLWNDPAMKPFRDRFVESWSRDINAPLQKALGVPLTNLTRLLQGQVTLAITQDGWTGAGEDKVGNKVGAPGFLVLADARDRAPALPQLIQGIRLKWQEIGKTTRIQKIREHEFMALSVSSEDLPSAFRALFPRRREPEVTGNGAAPAKTRPSELLIGQIGSLLVAANSERLIKHLAVRLAGGTVPCLSATAGFESLQRSIFLNSPVYGWVNLKVLAQVWSRIPTPGKEQTTAPDVIRLDQLIRGTGLSRAEYLAFSTRQDADGLCYQVFLGAPASEREGLLRILAADPKDCSAPPFVPADVLEFDRWRIDLQPAWNTMKKMFGEISPQWTGSINLILDTANAAAKLKDPLFDIDRNLFGNLGDDLIIYQKKPEGPASIVGNGHPYSGTSTLYLVGSPNPDELADSLKSLLIFMSREAEKPAERDYLGRKIFAVPLPSIPLPSGQLTATGPTDSLYYAANRGYVALTKDVCLLEEYLRTSDAPVTALRDLQGLPEALQKVVNSASGIQGINHRRLAMKLWLDSRAGANSAGLGQTPGFEMLQTLIGLAAPERDYHEWVDYGLLPSFEAVEKYFHFTVYGCTASPEGIWWKFFEPTPPALKR